MNPREIPRKIPRQSITEWKSPKGVIHRTTRVFFTIEIRKGAEIWKGEKDDDDDEEEVNTYKESIH